jgi:hypothetical protein
VAIEAIKEASTLQELTSKYSILTWINEDVLKMLASTAKLASFSSVSKRFSGDVIYLKHLWINMVKNQANTV